MRRKTEWLLVCAVVVSTAMFLTAIPLHLRPIYQVDNAEGVILATAAHVNAGHPAYDDPNVIPVYLSPYGPLFYALVAFITRHMGLSLFWPRGLALAATVVVTFCIALLARKWTKSTALAFVCALVFFNSALVQSWSSILRADLPALALSMIGLTFFVLSERRWYWSIPFFTAALFCKYSVLSAPVACFVWFIWHGRLKNAFVLAGSMALITAGGFFWVQYATDGWFFFHMFQTHPDPILWDQFADMFKRMIATEWVIIAFALWFMLRSGSGQSLATRESLLLPRLFLVLSFLASISASKLGANTNYFLEFIAVLTICAGIGYQHLVETQTTPRLTALGLASLAALLVTGSVIHTVPKFTVQRAGLADCSAAYAFLSAQPGRNILAENVGAAVITKKQPLVSDPFMYTQLIDQRTLSQGPILEQLLRRQVPIVVMGEELSFYNGKQSARWSGRMIDAIRENYHPVARFKCQDANTILQPNPEP